MINKENIEHIFFDLDHTLWDFDFNAGVCLHEIFEEINDSLLVGINKSQFIDTFNKVNQELWSQLESKLISHDHLRIHRFRIVFESFGVSITETESNTLNELFLNKLPNQSGLLPFAIDILEYLKAKYNLHILSNGFHHIQIKKMQSAGILNYFDKVITNEKANALKPDPLIFEFALNDTGALKSNSVMVGDNYFADIKGALNVGIPFLHLTNSDQDFEYSNKGFGISCLSQLKMYL